MFVECTHCGSEMSRTGAADGQDYWSCPRCVRTYHSGYEEIFRREAGARRAQVAPEAPAPDPGFDAVKSRLDSWLRRLDEQDPWFVLGVTPGAPLDTVRSRYRELALEHHPDRGGDPSRMRKLSTAYEAIRGGKVSPVRAVGAVAMRSSAMAARPNLKR